MLDWADRQACNSNNALLGHQLSCRPGKIASGHAARISNSGTSACNTDRVAQCDERAKASTRGASVISRRTRTRAVLHRLGRQIGIRMAGKRRGEGAFALQGKAAHVQKSRNAVLSFSHRRCWMDLGQTGFGVGYGGDRMTF